MYVTPLNFTQVLERFYNQEQYDFLLLFVSSFDSKDKHILQNILDNADRIDRIIGKRICFFYFIKEQYDQMNENIVRWVKNINDYTPLYGEGVSITMNTADDICSHFHLLRSELPAFILVNRHSGEVLVYSINDYNDFELLLTPINILHSYIEDKRNILSGYESRKRRILSEYNEKRKSTVVSEFDVHKRKSDIGSWEAEIRKLKRQKKVLQKTDIYTKDQIDTRISELYNRIEENPMLVVCGEDESVPFPQEELGRVLYPQEALLKIKEITLKKLNISLTSDRAEEITRCIDDSHTGYTQSIRIIIEELTSKELRISNTMKSIRYEIAKRGFDVFISCKSQDYRRAFEIYGFLKENGYRPFLADISIKEVGIDQYTALIGEVISECNYMIVFATDINYIETPYVMAEWHSFVNDINTGYKSNAKLLTVLSPEINAQELPLWLRDKQSFTTDNYKDHLVDFLK